MNKKPHFEDLKLLPGTKLDLRSEEYAALKGSSVLVGFKSKTAIIVSTPLKHGTPISCKAGNTLVVRFFINHLNCACAFRTEITHVSVIPFPLLYLAPPKIMEVGEVRSSTRADTKLISSVMVKGAKTPQSALIDNISADGAKLHTQLMLGQEGDDIKISTKVNVLDINNVIKLNGVIRSVTETKDDYVYGVQFIDVDNHSKLIIYAFVMSQLTH